jgi:superfamily II DNA/RNA helicase
MTTAQFNTLLEDTLSEAGITAFTALQETLINRVKSGGDAIFVCAHDAELIAGISLAAIQKAPQAFEGSPRVLILSPTIDDVHLLRDQIKSWVRRTEIAVELAHDKGNMVLERNQIFDGADIIVGNPKRIMDLYNQNGIHVNQLVLLMVHGTDQILQHPVIAQTIARLCESLPGKCQRVLFTTTQTDRLNKLSDQICRHPKVQVITYSDLSGE